MSGHRNSQAPLDMRCLYSFPIFCLIVTAWAALIRLLRVVLVFIEHRTVVSAMESVAADCVPGQGQSQDIREAFRKAWSVNLISQVDASKVPIYELRTGVILTLEYQTVFPLLGPMQGILDFGTLEVDGR